MVEFSSNASLVSFASYLHLIHVGKQEKHPPKKKNFFQKITQKKKQYVDVLMLSVKIKRPTKTSTVENTRYQLITLRKLPPEVGFQPDTNLRGAK